MKNVLLSLVVATLMGTNVYGVEVWLSPSNIADDNHTQGSPTLMVNSADTTPSEFHIWLRPDDGKGIEGIDLDLVSTEAGIIDFTNATIINPAMSQNPTQNRWEFDNVASNDLSVGSDGNVGVNSWAAPQDLFYDPVNNAWLFATIQFTPGAVGVTDLYLQIGSENQLFGDDNGDGTISNPTSSADFIFGSSTDPAVSEVNTNSLTADGTIVSYMVGDMDRDGDVDFDDIQPFTQWLLYPDEYTSTYDIAGDLIGDFDNDGDTDYIDNGLFAEYLKGNYQDDCECPQVPEPSSILLFTVLIGFCGSLAFFVRD